MTFVNKNLVKYYKIIYLFNGFATKTGILAVLNLICDYCHEVYYTWKKDRDNRQNIITGLDLWREHICNRCLAIKRRVMGELETWSQEKTGIYADEYQKKFNELFRKYKQGE